jgi:hypothetical protein
MRNKPVLLFALKLLFYFSLLAAPISFFDSAYGNYYRSLSKLCFHNFYATGVSVFSKTRNPQVTRIDLGNRVNKHANGAIDTATSEFNTRYRGYIPTILFLSLLLATPISGKRKLFAAVSGVILLTVAVMLKQWIHLLYMCVQASWLKLFEFTEKENERIIFIYTNIANYNGPTLIFAIAVWILVSFRKIDFDTLLN